VVLSVGKPGTWAATGTTSNGYSDKFEFDGELQAWSAEKHPDSDSDEYTLYVDGQEVDPSQYGDDTSTEPLPNRITFDGSNGRSGTYSFEVSGEIEADPDTAALESTDTISGASATGEVNDESDSYRFSGDLVDFSLSGTATVTIDDTE
jgi:hypothetical protein